MKKIPMLFPLLIETASYVAQIAHSYFSYIAKILWPFIAALFIGLGIWYTGYSYQQKKALLPSKRE